MTTPAYQPRRRTAAALVLLGLVAILCVALGRWQLDRAQLRREMQAAMEQGRQQPALLLASDTPATQLQPWRQAWASGTWRHDRTVLVENRNHDGKPGYWVVTPLALSPTAGIAVLRGWVPRRFDGSLPDIPAPTGPQDAQGVLLEHVPRMFELPSLWRQQAATTPGQAANAPTPSGASPGRSINTPAGPGVTTDNGSGPSGNAAATAGNATGRAAGAAPHVMTNLDLVAYQQYTGMELLPAVLQQQAATGDNTASARQPADDLVREWAGPSLDADKNIGYALQWFGFAAIAAGAWLTVAWRAWRRRRNGMSS